jgi:indolepyruvate ferredoxin oxidoreductase beta subunit
MSSGVTSVVLAGLGGQGVLKASDILADAAFRVGLDVKKSEVHGMSQRGGSVTSDVRYGDCVYSPLISAGEADIVVVLAPDQVELARRFLKPGGRLLDPAQVNAACLPSRRTFNVAMLGLLSMQLALPREAWLEALTANLKESVLTANLVAFHAGREAACADGEWSTPALELR